MTIELLNPILITTFKKTKELFLEDRSRQPEEDIFFIAISCLTPSRLSKSEACKINVKKDK